MKKDQSEGKLIIVSAPSGSGKTSIVRYLLEHQPGLEFSISATSRAPRKSEKHGVDYYFMTADEFRQRINKAAREEKNEATSKGDPSQWLLGPILRSKGSLHSDHWIGTGSDLAQRGYIGVYPVTGWWKERHQLGRWNRPAHYSLIVTIATPKIDVDIYTPIVTQITIESEV